MNSDYTSYNINRERDNNNRNMELDFQFIKEYQKIQNKINIHDVRCMDT